MSSVACYCGCGDNDHNIACPLKLRNEFIKVSTDDCNRVGLLTVKSHVASDRVPHPPLGEGGVMRYEHRPAVVGVDGDVIVIGGWGETSGRRPTLVASFS